MAARAGAAVLLAGLLCAGARPASAAGPAVGTVVPAAPGSVGVRICVPLREVLRVEAGAAAVATLSYAEQGAADLALRAALDQMSALVGPAGPRPVGAAIATLRAHPIGVSDRASPGTAAALADAAFTLRRYLWRICGGEPGSLRQEQAIQAALGGFLAREAGGGCGDGVADIRVSRADPAYAAAEVVPECQAPGGGTALLRQDAAGRWRVEGVLQALPCGMAPAPALADLFGADVPALCRTMTESEGGVPAVRPVPLRASGKGLAVSGSYPRLTGMRGAEAEGAVDAAIRRAVLADVAAFRRGAGAGGGRTLVLSYRVPFLRGGLFSVELIELVRAAGAAHPALTVRTLNFDLASGYGFRLADLFRPGADYVGFVEGVARRSLDGRYGGGAWRAAAAGPDPLGAWTFTDGGISVAFPGAAPAPAVPSVLVPYGDPVLQSLARPGMLPGGGG